MYVCVCITLSLFNISKFIKNFAHFHLVQRLVISGTILALIMYIHMTCPEIALHSPESELHDTRRLSTEELQ
jgi:hypothetical protein